MKFGEVSLSFACISLRFAEGSLKFPKVLRGSVRFPLGYLRILFEVLGDGSLQVLLASPKVL